MKTTGKRVLVLTERFYPEEFIVNDLVMELAARGLAIDVLTQAPSYPFGRVSAYPGHRNSVYTSGNWNGITVRRFFTITGYQKSRFIKVVNYLVFAVVSSLVVLFSGRRYDRLFVFHSGPLTMALAAIVSKALFRHRTVIWTLDLWPDTVYMYGFRRSFLNRLILDHFVNLVYRQFDVVFCSSPAFVGPIKSRTGNAAVFSLMQWPQVSGEIAEAPEISLDNGFCHFSYTGNVAWTQNLENVILGFSQAFSENSNIRLNIFGDGSDLPRLRKLVGENNCQGIEFWGRKPVSAMPSVFSGSAALIVSLQPDPVFEMYVPFKFSTYLASGRPVFAILNGAVKKMVEDHAIGVVADPADPVSIRDGFLELSRMDATRLSACGRNAVALLDAEFDRETNIGRIYRSLSSVDRKDPGNGTIEKRISP
jgi:glycosyltransferase involved in cell wall biosynthesis